MRRLLKNIKENYSKEEKQEEDSLAILKGFLILNLDKLFIEVAKNRSQSV